MNTLQHNTYHQSQQTMNQQQYMPTTPKEIPMVNNNITYIYFSCIINLILKCMFRMSIQPVTE